MSFVTSWLSKKSIKTQLLTMAICSSLFLASLTVYAYFALGHIDHFADVFATEHLPISESNGRLNTAINGVPRYLWLSLAHENPAERNQYLIKVGEQLQTLQKNEVEFGQLVQKVDQESYALILKLNPHIKDLESLVNDVKLHLEKNNRANDELAKELMLAKMPQITKVISDGLTEIDNKESKERQIEIESADHETQTTQRTMIVISLVISMLLFGVNYSITTQLVQRLSHVTREVSQSTLQVSSASHQLSRSSEELSNLAQQQASSIEETSASLLEISGMIQSNTRNSENANQLAQSIQTVSDDTRRHMDDLANAMSEILESNQKIFQLVKIIEEIGEKTEIIDEIVFKTQLLSFNASVEAERAGEHGRGFAVVAQEVGNLAQMSGQAATDISSIVKRSIREAEKVAQENKGRVEYGENLAKSTNSKMKNVTDQLTEIVETTNMITTASREQADGITQISQAVESLNLATQTTSSTSEETASSSEELSSQADTLKNLVQVLTQIVTGHNVRKRTFIESESKSNVVQFAKPKKPTAPATMARNYKKASGGGDFGNPDDQWENL